MTRSETEKFHKKVAEYIRRHPEKTFTTMARETGISLPMISKIAIRYGLGRAESVGRFALTDDLLKILES